MPRLTLIIPMPQSSIVPFCLKFFQSTQCGHAFGDLWDCKFVCRKDWITLTDFLQKIQIALPVGLLLPWLQRLLPACSDAQSQNPQKYMWCVHTLVEYQKQLQHLSHISSAATANMGELPHSICTVEEVHYCKEGRKVSQSQMSWQQN